MKNERIHELDKRLILMETVVRGWQRLVGDGSGGSSCFYFLGTYSVRCVEGRHFEEGPAWSIPAVTCHLCWPLSR